jgi:hypothetical protein
VDFELINSKLGGYSGDDITNICRDAAMNGMRRKIAGKTAMEIREMSKDAMKEPITLEDFLQVCLLCSRLDLSSPYLPIKKKQVDVDGGSNPRKVQAKLLPGWIGAYLCLCVGLRPAHIL